MQLDVIDHLQLDHERIRTLLDRARDADPSERGTAAAALVDALVRHETAEAALVRPRTRETRDGHPVAWSLDRQERTIGRLLAVLEMTDAGETAAWEEVLQRLREAVLHHFAAEEHAEHPRLRGECGAQTLVDLGRRFVRVTALELGNGDAPTAGARDGHGADGAAVFAQAREVIRRALLH